MHLIFCPASLLIRWWHNYYCTDHWSVGQVLHLSSDADAEHILSFSFSHCATSPLKGCLAGHRLHHCQCSHHYSIIISNHHQRIIVIRIIHRHQDNGFSDILVGISPDVPESPEMLEQLKQVLTKASASLYTATRWSLMVVTVTKVTMILAMEIGWGSRYRDTWTLNN